MEVQVLGSSSAGNCIVVRDGSTLLLEAGIRYRDIQQALAFRVSQLAACLVSHEHQDHARSVKDLIKAGVNVYASAGTIAALGLRSHRLHAVAPLAAFEVPGWTVLPFPTVHDAAEPLGFLLAGQNMKVLYLTDTAYCAYTFPGLTHVLIETNYRLDILRARTQSGELAPEQFQRVVRNHLSLEHAIELLQANDLSQVQEIHLLHLSDGNSDEAAFKDAVARATGKPVFIAPRS